MRHDRPVSSKTSPGNGPSDRPGGLSHINTSYVIVQPLRTTGLMYLLASALLVMRILAESHSSFAFHAQRDHA